MNKPKQIIVIRKDLKMRAGKMVAQGAHASMAVLLNMGTFQQRMDDDGSVGSHTFTLNLAGYPYIGADQKIVHQAVIDWLTGTFTKICVSCDSEQELLDLEGAANAAGLLNCLIVDSGLTEFNGVPTRTCLAIGPDYSDRIDPITKHLKLL